MADTAQDVNALVAEAVRRFPDSSIVPSDYDIPPEKCSDQWLARRLATALTASVEPFQSRVQPWMMACFGAEIAGDKLERADRFIEEALELVQAGDYPPERAHALVDYVFNRAKGEPAQEVGGVMVTLAALCLASNLDMHAAGETELARIWTKVDAIRAKQAAKPTGSALPVASSDAATEREKAAYARGVEDAAKVARGTHAYDDELRKSVGFNTMGDAIATAILALKEDAQ